MATKTQDICAICCEEFNRSTRAEVACPACPLKACRTCVRHYVSSTPNMPHCMGCKNRWERDFLVDATLKSFVNGAYKDHRKRQLFDLEKARLPETMPAVENYLKVEGLKKELDEAKERKEEMEQLWRDAKHREYNLRHLIQVYRRGGNPGQEKRKFMRQCPAEDCRGFLSSAWKCGVCDMWSCPHCLELKGPNKDTAHECNPDSVKSAELMKKETRPCPRCAVPIFKISGCDQMWCTQCHIAFSWKTGQQVNGVIHNPHFYAFQREGGQVVRPPGAVACGGLPAFWRFRRCIYALFTGDPQKQNTINVSSGLRKLIETVLNLHRGAAHFGDWELRRRRERVAGFTDNQQLRIKFILKEITEDEFRRKLCSRDKSHNKQLAVLQVYELLGTVLIETVNDISRLCEEERADPNHTTTNFVRPIEQIMKDRINRCEKVRCYANTALVRISAVYSQVVGIITSDYESETRKFLTRDIGDDLDANNPIPGGAKKKASVEEGQ